MVISSPCLTDIKNWLVQKQTAFGKDFSNPFTADSLLKTIWFSTHHASHAPCYSNEALAIPEQTATGKEISNPFMAGEDCWVLEDFTTYCCWFNIGAASEDLVLLRKIEENRLRSRPDWLFDIDLLTNSINYEPVTAGNKTNRNAGIKEYILLPLLYDSPQSSEDAVSDDVGKKSNEEPANKGERNGQEKG
ncbi:hypothetical protein Tco_1162755 [Tanacetum coccineum]